MDEDRRRDGRGRTRRWLAAAAAAAALALAAGAQQARADAAPAAPCRAGDLDCRAFAGTLDWRPDERRPLLSSKGVRRLALLRHLPGGERERAARCLAFVAWAEARSDGAAGMKAVVAVVLNRSRSPAYPEHPCDVIGQPGAFEPLLHAPHRRTALALKRRALAPFPRPANPVEARSLRAARELVWRLATARELRDPTGGATHFVAPKVLRARGQPMPRWIETMVRTARIGDHHFYRAAELRVAHAP